VTKYTAQAAYGKVLQKYRVNINHRLDAVNTEKTIQAQALG